MLDTFYEISVGYSSSKSSVKTNYDAWGLLGGTIAGESRSENYAIMGCYNIGRELSGQEPGYTQADFDRHNDWCQRDISEDIRSVSSDMASAALNNPNVQGALQMSQGLAEIGIGAGVTYGSAGLAAPVGGLIMAHGFDNLFTGMHTIYSGVHQDTLTCKMLSSTGMSMQTARMVDGGISMVGSMGGAALIARTRHLAAASACSFNLVATATTGSISSSIGNMSTATLRTMAKNKDIYSHFFSREHMEFYHATGRLVREFPSYGTRLRFLQIMKNVCANPANLKEASKHLCSNATKAGVERFAQVYRCGREIWADYRKGVISNGGVNRTPKH